MKKSQCHLSQANERIMVLFNRFKEKNINISDWKTISLCQYKISLWNTINYNNKTKEIWQHLWELCRETIGDDQKQGNLDWEEELSDWVHQQDTEYLMKYFQKKAFNYNELLITGERVKAQDGAVRIF